MFFWDTVYLAPFKQTSSDLFVDNRKFLYTSYI